MNGGLGRIFKEHPNRRYIMFGGKGGLGKTTFSAATAYWLAKQGHRVLVFSVDPQASLSDIFQRDIFGKRAVEIMPNLFAYEIDTRETIEKSKRETREKVSWFLKFAEIRTQADAFVESATMNPAFEESAMFENMIDIMFTDEFEVYVFDTAPTANARRLLGMSSVYSLWVGKMMKRREEAQSLRHVLSYSKEEEDPLMDCLLSFQERMRHAKELLTDQEKTAFFFVTLPEALPIAVITRIIAWFKEFGIPVGGVVINMLIDKQQVRPDSPEFVRNRMAMQDAYMREIEQTFAGMVRAVLPLYETEVRGVEMLRRTADALYGA